MKRRLFSLLVIPFLLLYAFPAGAVEKEEREWQDETMYFLMVDRFGNGDNANDKDVNTEDPAAYQGGDFKGIETGLDDLKDMGFTTIILSPIFKNAPNSYHGYQITNYKKLNPYFGSMKDFNHLLKEAHKKDMKVLIDFPVTHVSASHPWVKDESKADWFKSKSETDYEWMGDRSALDLEKEPVKQEIIQSAKWWTEQTELDGYYLSNATGAPADFWKDFSKEVKSVKKDFFLMGESAEKDLNLLNEYQQAGLDSVTNPAMTEPLREQFKNIDQDSETTPKLLKETESISNNPRLTANRFDSHLMNRYTRDMVNEHVFPGTRWKLALTYLYTIPGLPIVYYGSEIALDGGEGTDNHRFMSFRADKELIDYVTKLGELRQQLPALTRGTYEPIYSKDGMTVLKREYKDEVIIVGVNNSGITQKVSIPAEELDANKELRGLLAGDLVRPQDGKFTIYMDRETSEIYALAKKTGINMSFVMALAGVYVVFMIFLYLVWKRGRTGRKA
ncbi:glycosidase [Bacillus ectoiniformans]|uniref:alpha-amylase family glycosyl hydrolase n=1 Tax=Bacillus ectoiniformans TaxID=1494429 RepID=UPI00195BCCBE|nr:alpha-amylase family glycosyl hydrolase [Bacillus ectoiniformans]MBM7647565.1 glycosidase [Bacillus ectoiniformans]